jgi:hypothetical protein
LTPFSGAPQTQAPQVQVYALTRGGVRSARHGTSETCRPERETLVGKKILLFLLVGLCVWNLTKLPYYVAFDPADATDAYARHGLEGSINLGHWVEGYHGTKLKSPAINFLAVHNVVGITVLMMMAFALVRPRLRRRFGPLFFPFAILLGAHTVPAAWMMDGAFRKYLFTATCVLVIGAALFGLVVLRRYERDPPAAEKRLLIAYSLITLGAYGAGFAEFYQIGSNAIARLRTGLWPDFGALPHALAGNTPYDRIPEAIGWTVFVLWIAIVWLAWPARRLRTNR